MRAKGVRDRNGHTTAAGGERLRTPLNQRRRRRKVFEPARVLGYVPRFCVVHAAGS